MGLLRAPKHQVMTAWWCNVPILKNDGLRQWVSDDIPYIVTDNHLEHHFFSKISEPVLRTSKQLHLEHQNCSKYALRTSEKHILRTSPLIFAYLEH